MHIIVCYVQYIPPACHSAPVPLVQLFYQAAGNVCNNGCHDKLDEGKVQEMVTGMLGDVSGRCSSPECL